MRALQFSFAALSGKVITEYFGMGCLIVIVFYVVVGGPASLIMFMCPGVESKSTFQP